MDEPVPTPDPQHRTWRIVDTDNFGGDYPNEQFLLWELRKETAEKIAELLNKEAGPDAQRYYKVVPRGYKLEPGFEQWATGDGDSDD